MGSGSSTIIKDIPVYTGYVIQTEVDEVVKDVKDCYEDKKLTLARRKQHGCSDTDVPPCKVVVDDLRSDPDLFRKEVLRLYPSAQMSVKYLRTTTLVDDSNDGNIYELRLRNCALVDLHI